MGGTESNKAAETVDVLIIGAGISGSVRPTGSTGRTRS